MPYDLCCCFKLYKKKPKRKKKELSIDCSQSAEDSEFAEEIFLETKKELSIDCSQSAEDSEFAEEIFLETKKELSIDCSQSAKDAEAIFLETLETIPLRHYALNRHNIYGAFSKPGLTGRFWTD